jgi:hypothetical protein
VFFEVWLLRRTLHHDVPIGGARTACVLSERRRGHVNLNTQVATITHKTAARKIAVFFIIKVFLN